MVTSDTMTFFTLSYLNYFYFYDCPRSCLVKPQGGLKRLCNHIGFQQPPIFSLKCSSEGSDVLMVSIGRLSKELCLFLPSFCCVFRSIRQFSVDCSPWNICLFHHQGAHHFVLHFSFNGCPRQCNFSYCSRCQLMVTFEQDLI